MGQRHRCERGVRVAAINGERSGSLRGGEAKLREVGGGGRGEVCGFCLFEIRGAIESHRVVEQRGSGTRRRLGGQLEARHQVWPGIDRARRRP